MFGSVVMAAQVGPNLRLLGEVQDGIYREMRSLEARPAGRPPRLGVCGARPLGRPSAGSAQWATRHGCRVSRPRPWMADGGGPTEQDRSEGMPSLGEAPNERGRNPLVTLGFFSKVTCRKGGTLSSRYRRNGYVPQSKERRSYFSARSFRAFKVLNGASTTNLLATIDGMLPPGSVCT